MPDPNQAQIEENSASNKNVQPNKTYGQATVYATLPQGPNVSGSGRANPPPEPILGPTEKPVEPNESSMAQFESIHPELKPMSDLTGGVSRENQNIYQYSKNQTEQIEPLHLQPSEPKDTSGLVNIKASEFTKDGVTTSIVEVPAVSYDPLQYKESEIGKTVLYGKTIKTFTPGPESNLGGEAVSFLKVPFSGIKSTNENEPLVQSTSLVDLLGVTPVGGGEAAKGLELLSKGVSKVAGKDLASVTSKIVPAFKEGESEVRTETLSKGVNQLTQGTEQKITLTELKPEKAPLTKTVDIEGEKFEVKAGFAPLPKGITETKTLEGIGKVGEKTVAHEPTNEEIANRYPLFGQGKNDLSDLSKGELPKQIPETEKRPVFGKITEEVPNLIDITKQAAKSGPSELSEAFVSEKQVVFTRSPSELEENKIIITGKPSPAIISTFGLKLVSGTKNVFISSDLTKGMKEYLLGAEKAGLITPRLSETHLQSVKDVLTNAKLYAKASREPKIFETFPEIVRPEVIGTRESYQMKTQLFKKSADELRSFKKMQPFGPIQESKGGAGSSGKANALLEEKAEPKILNKPEIFKSEKEIANSSNEVPIGLTSSTVVSETLAYPKGTDTKFLQSFRNNEPELLSKSKSISILTETTEKTSSLTGLDILEKNVQNTLSITNQKEESLSDLLSKNELTSKQESGLISRQTEEQITGLTTKQTTIQITTTGNHPPPNITTTNNPPPNLIIEQRKKDKKKKLKQFKAKDINFLGASTESTVVGLVNREELSYGNKKTAKLLSKGKKLEKGQNFISYTKRVISYKPEKNITNKPTKLITSKSKKPKF